MTHTCNLGRLLTQDNISHARFSQWTGIPKPTIWRMTNNLLKRYPPEHIALICENLGCDVFGPETEALFTAKEN